MMLNAIHQKVLKAVCYHGLIRLTLPDKTLLGIAVGIGKWMASPNEMSIIIISNAEGEPATRSLFFSSETQTHEIPYSTIRKIEFMD